MKFYSTILQRPSFLFLLSVLSLTGARAQSTATSSPYSRFALGRPENTGFAALTAVGGSFTAFRNDTTTSSTYYINQGNPSSYAFTKYTIYEFGARYGFSNFTSTDAQVKKQNGGFNYIALGFPIRKRMGAAFGLIPFSSVGYEVSTSTESVDSIGSIKNNYRGNGGINQVFGGLAYRPFESRPRRFLSSQRFRLLDSLGAADVIRRKKFFANALSTLSVGANVSYLYGNVNYATRKYFPGTLATVFNTCDYTETQLHDVYFQGGAQMSFEVNSVKTKKSAPDTAGKSAKVYRDLKKKWRFTLAYSVSVPRDVSASGMHVAYSFLQGSFGREIPYDTFSYNPSFKGSVYLPLMQSIGVGIKKGEAFNVYLDAGHQQWSQFSFLGSNQGLRDQYRFAGGAQWQPHRQAIGTGAYFKRAFYRVGGRYNTGYLFLKNNQLSEYAVSGGVGLPVGRRVFTIVNISAEYGVGGTTREKLVQERFLRFVVGLTFNDRWFIKPKYD
jgi:hypothetical protein